MNKGDTLPKWWNYHYCDNCKYQKLSMFDDPCRQCCTGDDKWEEGEYGEADKRGS